MAKDYMMRPKRQTPPKAKPFTRKLVSITPKTDETGLFLMMARYENKEKVGEAVLHQDTANAAEVKQLIEEFRNL